MMENTSTPAVASDLVAGVEARRLRHSTERRSAGLGQVFTPMVVASMLSEMFDAPAGAARVLDPGAGVGSLTAALVGRAVAEGWRSELDLTAVEIDPGLIPPLQRTIEECRVVLPSATGRTRAVDFIDWGCRQLDPGLFDSEGERFDLAILNPPYRKLGARSPHDSLLSRFGIKARNLYAAFVALSLRLLRPGGQLVAIIPRSFCNGPYFRAFRTDLLDSSSIRRVHVFGARDRAFRDAGVLQENVIVHLVKSGEQGEVMITSSLDAGSGPATGRHVPFERVVHPADSQRFIHLTPSDDSHAMERVRSLEGNLESAGVSVSTGRVVDFRARKYLRRDPEDGAVPLIHPLHFRHGRIRWPASGSKKANALVATDATRKMLLPSENYVLVKRFSSKEQSRRVVASVLMSTDLPYDCVGIENHVNVLYRRGGSLSIAMAWGIAAYLNSTIVDTYFRQFNGHTQVNATDLRSLSYPTVMQLEALGREASRIDHTQEDIDAAVERHIPELAGR